MRTLVCLSWLVCVGCFSRPLFTGESDDAGVRDAPRDTATYDAPTDSASAPACDDFNQPSSNPCGAWAAAGPSTGLVRANGVLSMTTTTRVSCVSAGPKPLAGSVFIKLADTAGLGTGTITLRLGSITDFASIALTPMAMGAEISTADRMNTNTYGYQAVELPTWLKLEPISGGVRASTSTTGTAWMELSPVLEYSPPAMDEIQFFLDTPNSSTTVDIDEFNVCPPP